MSDLYLIFVVLLQLFAFALVATVVAGLLFALALADRPRLAAHRINPRRRRRFSIPLAWIA